MASLSMADMTSRTTSMAEPAKKKNWIKQDAPKERRGAFKEKAKEEGPAENLMGASHKRKKKSPLYDHSSSKRD
jgi:hypothetical protein